MKPLRPCCGFAQTRAALLLLVGVCGAWPGTAAGVSIEDFVPLWFTNAQGVLPYRLFIPAHYTTGQQYPLVLFLHGSVQRGDDNQSQLEDMGVLVFASATNQATHPSFMVAPQCPAGAAWTDYAVQTQVLGMIKALEQQFSLDKNRVYITGLSLGAYGIWQYIATYPTMYAAAIPLAGGGDTSTDSPNLTQLPIWDFHAADDPTVPVDGSRAMISAIRQAGGNPIYTEYRFGGHGPWTEEYNTPILMDWVYAQRRAVMSTTPPLLSIASPTSQAIYATAEPTLSLAGTATDGGAGPTSVTWTNYRVSRAYPYYTPVGSGVAARTTNWAVTNLALFPGYANRIIVTGTGTSWNAALGGVTTFNRTLTVIFPPFITLQPQSQTVNQGDPVSFSLSVTTLAPPVQYQWRFDGTNMVGTTNATLGLSHAQLTNAGLYSVVVSNQFGALISSNAVLAVNQIPIARCADVVVSAGPGCVAYASVDNGSFDPDGDAITLSQSPPGPYPLGTNEVVLTAIDSKGASNSCRAR